jgi:FkbM family methyltransferase
MTYDHLLHIREDYVSGVGPWTWAKTDIHGWAGPKQNWEQGHKNMIDGFVKEKHTVVQAGGNMGMYPRLLSDMFQRVYTFEPDPINFHCLVANCQKDNIIKLNAALGFRHELVEMSVDPFPDWEINYGIRTVVKSENSSIPTLTIDDLNLDRCDLIMLDVEFQELNVLKGTVNTLERFDPILFVEYHPFNNEKINPAPFLKAFGYHHVAWSFHDLIFAKQ